MPNKRHFNYSNLGKVHNNLQPISSGGSSLLMFLIGSSLSLTQTQPKQAKPVPVLSQTSQEPSLLSREFFIMKPFSNPCNFPVWEISWNAACNLLNTCNNFNKV